MPVSAWYVPASLGCFAPEHSPENETGAWGCATCSLLPVCVCRIQQHANNVVLSFIGVVEDSFTVGILQALNIY